MLSSLRDLLTSPLQAWLRKEADRARKSQTTPEKLQKHVDSFYSDVVQRSTLAYYLRPAMRAWLVFNGSDADVDRVCLAVAMAHFE